MERVEEGEEKSERGVRYGDVLNHRNTAHNIGRGRGFIMYGSLLDWYLVRSVAMAVFIISSTPDCIEAIKSSGDR